MLLNMLLNLNYFIIRIIKHINERAFSLTIQISKTRSPFNFLLSLSFYLAHVVFFTYLHFYVSFLKEVSSPTIVGQADHVWPVADIFSRSARRPAD